MYEESARKRRRREDSMAEGGSVGDGEGERPLPGLRVQENPRHGMRVLHGLNLLKRERLLCDVTLIAEGK